MSIMPRTANRDNSFDSTGEFPMGVSEYFFYLLFLTARYRDQALDKVLARTGLNVARWRTLAVIRRIENCTMSQLARFAGVDRTTLTRSVDQLVEQGLVERWTPSRDRRLVNLALSETGSQVYDQAVQAMMASNAGALPGIEEADLRTAARALQSVLNNLAGDRRTADDLLTFGRPGPSN
jgi:MarR family transcriptional regulator, lower aerobic nicotinate degradation pathway regulator